MVADFIRKLLAAVHVVSKTLFLAGHKLVMKHHIEIIAVDGTIGAMNIPKDGYSSRGHAVSHIHREESLTEHGTDGHGRGQGGLTVYIQITTSLSLDGVRSHGGMGAF